MEGSWVVTFLFPSCCSSFYSNVLPLNVHL
jgi:hypothetical protein